MNRCGFACPICGDDKPHFHTENDKKFRRDQITFRLLCLVEHLRRPGFSFYEAMNRVYETHYGYLAEQTLARELETVCAELGRLGGEPVSA
jgi:hypothetical protein